MTDEKPWHDRYQITSMTGRIWSRRMIDAAARTYIRRLWYGTKYLEPALREISEILDDDRWCTFRRGVIPASFVRDVEKEALGRVAMRSM